MSSTSPGEGQDPSVIAEGLPEESGDGQSSVLVDDVSEEVFVSESGAQTFPGADST